MHCLLLWIPNSLQLAKKLYLMLALLEQLAMVLQRQGVPHMMLQAHLQVLGMHLLRILPSHFQQVGYEAPLVMTATSYEQLHAVVATNAAAVAFLLSIKQGKVRSTSCP